tara:strand:+ start:2386 stop:3246 length:861 start_codon:yes stop_codon:yes gene_type:complete
MSRNSRRRTSANQEVVAPQPITPNIQNSSNPFGISFVVPTEVVPLPSGGNFYDEGSALSGKDSLEIKQMTAKEEEILANVSFIEDGSLLNRLLASILIDTSVDPEELLQGDREALVYAARRISYGPEYAVKQHCENCGQETTFLYDLSEYTVTPSNPQGAEKDESTGLYNVLLPQSGVKVGLKHLTMQDEEFLKEQEDRASKLNIESSKTINFLKRVVVEANGVTDQMMLNKLFEVLPVLDIRKIKKISKSIIPTMDTKQEVACGNCGHVAEREVPFSLGFFWPEL